MQNNQTFYWVSVSNTLLTRSSAAAVLTVAVQNLAIVTQPADQSVNAGDQVTFAVAAQASMGPVTYQWSKNQAPIPGAVQPSYYIPYAAAGDAGSYSVTVTNSLGSLGSRTATLTVGPGADAVPVFREPAGSGTTLGTGTSYVIGSAVLWAIFWTFIYFLIPLRPPSVPRSRR